MFDLKTMYNRVISNINSEQLLLGLERKSETVIFISDEAEKFGGIHHFCLTEKNWSLPILWWPIQRSNEKLMLY